MSNTWSVGYRPGLVSYRLGKYALLMVSVNLMAVGEFFVIGRFISASQTHYVTQPAKWVCGFSCGSFLLLVHS